MRIVIGGSSGFLGSALTDRLRARGDDVVRLVRRPAESPDEVQWDPGANEIDAGALAGADAVVNLGGVGIGDKRWDDAHKQAVLQSRIDATSTLANAIAAMDAPPAIFVSSSAIGFYGDRDDETLAEDSVAGPDDDFLVQVVTKWEEAALPVVEAGVSLAFLRTGIVLGDGGVLDRLLLPFKLGLGGRMGDGQQWWSWITREDWVRAVLFIIDNKLSGAFNLTAPNPVRNSDFAKTLASSLNRPALIPTPAFALKAILGSERAQALIFTSARVLPQALRARDFEFVHPTLSEALENVLD